MTMDLWDFIKHYDIRDSYFMYTKAGTTEDGKALYSFYAIPDLYRHELYDKCVKVTFAPDILELELYEGNMIDGYYKEVENINLDDYINKNTGVALVKADDHLMFSDYSVYKRKRKIFYIETCDGFRCKIRNSPIDFEEISKAEFQAVSSKCDARISFFNLSDVED